MVLMKITIFKKKISQEIGIIFAQKVFPLRLLLHEQKA